MDTQKGNVLFLILIAVALFAALSFAVSSFNTPADSGVASDKAKIKASTLVQYASSISNTATRLVLGGCNVTQLSFFHASHSTGWEYVNPNSPGNFRCHIFHPSGGNISYIKSTADTLFYFPNGDGVGGIGTSNPELLIIIALKDQSICEAINRGLKLPSPETAGMSEGFLGNDYRGSFNNWNTLFSAPGSPAYGQHSACVKSKTGDSPQTWGYPYFYYHVVVAR